MQKEYILSITREASCWNSEALNHLYPLKKLRYSSVSSTTNFFPSDESGIDFINSVFPAPGAQAKNIAEFSPSLNLYVSNHSEKSLHFRNSTILLMPS
jgi:hypothetical protein